MIADFFKQSKPIVFLILGIILSLFFYLKVFINQDFSLEGNQLITTIINHIILVLSFIGFELSIKHFEIQKGHSLVSLFFVIFTSIVLVGVDLSFELLGFLVLSLGVIRLLAVTESNESNLRIYEAVILITLASLFYKPFILCLSLVLVASLLFTRPHWRYFVIPLFSISTVVIFVESYFLLRYNTIVQLNFFIPEIEFSIEAFYLKMDPVLTLFWLISSLVCVYQIFSVKQVRSLYHRNLATFFLVFLGLALLSLILSDSTLSGLWLMSLWPLCIYLGDFISRIKKRLWLQVWFFGFIAACSAVYFLKLLS